MDVMAKLNAKIHTKKVLDIVNGFCYSIQARSRGCEKRPAGESGPNLENDTEERETRKKGSP